MVKKLFKHEFLALSRLLVPVYVIFIAASILGRVLQLFESGSIVYTIISAFSVFIYVGSLIAVLVLTGIFCIVRYYKNMFSAEGYLTFTLPVTPTQHIMVKLVTALVCQIVTILAVMFSVSIITMGDVYNEIVKATVYLLNLINDEWAVHIWFYAIEVILLLIVSCGVSILLYYTCITIGQTFKKNRIMGAVGVYFLYYVATQTFGSVISVIASTLIGEDFAEKIGMFFEAHIKGCLHGVFCGSIVFNLLLGLAFFFIIKSIIKNKLNLE